MRNLRKFTFPVLVGILLLILAACGGGGDNGGSTPSGSSGGGSVADIDQTFTFQYVCVNRTLLPCQLVQQFIDAVDERTDGKVEIQISSYPELGISGFDMIRLLEDGSVGLGEIYSGFVGGEYPVFDVGNLWGLFTSTEQYYEAVDALNDDMKRVVTEKTQGGKVVAFNFYPSNFFFTKQPLEDFEGVRTRSHSNVLSDLVNELGGDAQTMAFAEVYTALERGILDGAVTCSTCGFGQKWNEVTDYLTGPIPGSFAQTFITFNSKEWESMPPIFQQIITEEGANHTARARTEAAKWDTQGVGQLVEGGMKYSEFTQEMLDVIGSAGEKAVLPRWVGRAGGYGSEGVDLYNEKIAAITGLRVNPDNTVTNIGR
ncbi:MAG: TRAP transporter substrate-binding protein DctP [Chloroflexi bacterium]|nr:TRAP transporter substrate-binding protein DctP [Chloroflexota bacterium]